MDHVVELKNEEAIDSQLIIGFIGWGGFAEGLYQHLLVSTLPQGIIYTFDPFPQIQKCEWQLANDIDEIFQKATLIFIDLPFQELEQLLPRIRLMVSDAHTLIFLGAGMTFKKIAQHINDRKVIRCLFSPVRQFTEMALAFVTSNTVSNLELKNFQQVLEGVPLLMQVQSEEQLEGLHGLLSTGPAMGYTLIDALADGAFKMGIPRHQGLTLAAHTLMNAAKTFLDTKIHPGVLRDNALQKEGTPFSGIMALEESGIRGIMAKFMEAAANEVRKRK